MRLRRRLVPLAARRRWWRLRDDLLTRRAALRHVPAARPARDPGRPSPVTDRLHARLADAAAVETALAREEAAIALPYPPGGVPDHARVRDLWARAAPAERRAMAVNLGLHLGLPAADGTGLSPVMPPTGVHDMAIGPLGTGGSLYHADLVVDGLGAPAAGARWLDFGCSSGRVVRVLAAAFPQARFAGCDPNAAAIAWAAANLGGAEFAVSPQDPPLPYGDGAFDAVFAISIWSHFDAAAATAWLREMHRVVRPGGRLLLTAHGYESLARYARTRERAPLAMQRALAELYREGFSFRPSFGAEGDWGVGDAGWGESFLAPEWLLAQATPAWSVVCFRPGGNEGNQDVYVLERAT